MRCTQGKKGGQYEVHTGKERANMRCTEGKKGQYEVHTGEKRGNMRYTQGKKVPI